MSKKPHVVVFFGGESGARDLSYETGHWVSQYIPRESYKVTPVHIRSDGRWQIPLGGLPARGSVYKMMTALFRGLPAVSAKEGLQRLLTHPIDYFLNVVRGKGGDDGGLQSLGSSIGIKVAGSSATTCQHTSQKHICYQHVDDITTTPLSLYFSQKTEVQDVIDTVVNQLTPPLFVKPVNQEGSVGVTRIESLEELRTAIKNVLSHKSDVLIQEALPGKEITITLLQGPSKRLTTLPAVYIAPRTATYYDHAAKSQLGRVHMHVHNDRSDSVFNQAESIARDVWDRLGCRGYASFDFIANNENIDLLEVNVIPTATVGTPLELQLKGAGIHPGTFIDQLIREA